MLECWIEVFLLIKTLLKDGDLFKASVYHACVLGKATCVFFPDRSLLSVDASLLFSSYWTCVAFLRAIFVRTVESFGSPSSLFTMKQKVLYSIYSTDTVQGFKSMPDDGTFWKRTWTRGDT